MTKIKVGNKYVARTGEIFEITRICKKTLHFAIFKNRLTGFSLQKPIRFHGPKDNFESLLEANGAKKIK